MKKSKNLQICGTGSGVGKSVIVAGLCRIFLQDGLRVCPFKAQNMALNSFVTKEDGEIGRAQASQAAACRIEPSVDMNPVLIKPTSDVGAQIIVRGKPYANMKAAEYVKYKVNLKDVVFRSFARLQNKYDVVVIEGAGSPAEINLKAHDIVNMKMAEHAKAPVVLVGDIDKGGVFAWLIGTLELLTKNERKMVKGFIINKFRGDKRLLKSGLDFLEKRTGLKVLGVIPYFKDIKIPEEDSVALEAHPGAGGRTKRNATSKDLIDIAVIKLPHISNFTDFDPLESEPDVRLRYVTGKDELNGADLIIIPGTKNTVADLSWLKKNGLARPIRTMNDERRTTIIGICGGYQMLGGKISDKYHLESDGRAIEGLGLLSISTCLAKKKVLARIKAKELSSGIEISGYEIHHGVSQSDGKYDPVFEVFEHNGKAARYFDGFRSKDGRIFGTYIHGLFDSDTFRRSFLNRLRQAKGWRPLSESAIFNTDKEFDKLAQLLRENIDMKSLYGIMMNYDGH